MDSSDDEHDISSQEECEDRMSDEIDSDKDDSDVFKSNHGWADAMAKVLKQKKPAGKKFIVLSKAKKIRDVKEKKPTLDFEIVNMETINTNDEDELDEKKPNIDRKLMKEYQAKGRIKPNILEKDSERILMKIATKGVVQLFNAVRQQQKVVDKTLEKAGKSEHKREKLLGTIDKKKFLDAISNSVKSVPLSKDIKSEDEDMEEENNTWSVLSDNFMMGSKLKDWDKYESED